MEEKRTTKIKNIILWWISIMLILYTLIYIGDATPQAICFGILAVLLMPPVNNKINEKFIKESRKNKIIKIVTEVLAFFVIIANLPANNTNQNYDKNNAIETTSKINTNTTNVLNKTNTSITNINTNETSTSKELESNNSTSTNTSNSVENSNSEITNSDKNQEENHSNTASTYNANQNTKNNNTNSNTKNINANTNTKSSNTKTTQSSTKKNTATSTKKTTTQSTSTTTTDNSRTVYVTPTGKRYHYISTCGGKNSTASTLNKAKARGLTPCQKCAK